MADFDYNNINHLIWTNEFEKAYIELNEAEHSPYTKYDKSLKSLDLGILSHYSQNFERSNQELSNAEKLFEETRVFSITQNLFSTFVNDTIVDYSADLYEDIYLNIFMALNYIGLEKYDDAMVEVRRFDNKLKTISASMQTQIEKQRLELKENSESVPNVSFDFHNSALARYLSMILYRFQGDYSNAEVDYKLMKEAFSMQNEIYDFKFPQEVKEELSVSKNDAHLNIFAFTGECPIKYEESIDLFCINSLYRVATPGMKTRNSDVKSVRFYAANQQTGDVYQKELSLIENIENIAVSSYEQKYASILGRTLLRMVAKLSTSSVLDEIGEQTDNPLFSILGLFSKTSSFFSERADVRCSRFFPQKAYVLGITLPEGDYDISIEYLNSLGYTIYSDNFSEFSVKKGELNMVEGVFLR